MSTETSSNKRVAKNAIALTLRMVLVTIVGLYTSRVVLEALGVDDYGIYGVIGGVVGMASFLNASMAGATSRFITFELGRGNQEKLKTIFSSALIIHLLIALVVAVLAETIGLWFVNNKMNFPPGRMFAVNVLYQFTIVSMMVNFTQVPYSAAIIAHEKMNIYAYFEIINVVLKLAIVYLLLIVNTDRLILYAALTLCVSVLTACIYRFYCVRHFQESKFKFVHDKGVMKDILTYSINNIYGEMCIFVNIQGIPIIINLFFGVIANAAASIAATVTGTIKGFSASIVQAFRPGIIKLYASNNIVEMQQLMKRAVQCTLLVYGMIAIPIFLKTHELLKFWLGQVPEYTVGFIRIVIITLLFNLITLVNTTSLQATGNIKRMSYISGTFYLLSPVFSWLLLKYMNLCVYTVYFVEVFCYFVACILNLYFISSQIKSFHTIKYFGNIVKSILSIAVSLILTYFIMNRLLLSINNEMFEVFLNLVICTLIGGTILAILTMWFVFDQDERNFAINIVKNKFNSIFAN